MNKDYWAREEGMATHSSILVAIIPWAEELGSLQSMVSKELDTTEVNEHAQTIEMLVLGSHLVRGKIL